MNENVLKLDLVKVVQLYEYPPNCHFTWVNFFLKTSLDIEKSRKRDLYSGEKLVRRNRTLYDMYDRSKWHLKSVFKRAIINVVCLDLRKT